MASQKNLSSPNYAAAIYCLTIEFYGYDAQGNLVAPARGQYTTNGQLGSPSQQSVIQKYYPFLIENLTFKLANKQIEYQITGKPVAYQTSLSYDRGSIPFQFELVGETV